MTSEASCPFVGSIVESLRRVSLVCAMLAFVVAALPLAFWIFGLSTPIAPGLGRMPVSTCMGLMLGGIALGLVHCDGRRPRCAVLTLASILLLLGAFTLVACLSGFDVEIDRLLFGQDRWRDEGRHPGRMAPHTALVIVILSAALLAFPKETKCGARVAEVLAILMLLSSMLALLGYAYDAHWLYEVCARAGMALHTAVGAALLALSILFARPDRGHGGGAGERADT